MANKAHKNLTGVDLHEPKGIASATSGQHYIADGVGSGVWSTIVIPTGTFYVTVTSFTASGTWTKPANLFVAKVHVQAEGGGVPGGQHDGASSSFGSHCSATGGTGASAAGAPGTGGTGSSGSLNLTGGSGVSANGSTDAGSYPLPGGLPGGPFTTKGNGVTNSSLGGSTVGSGGGGGYSMKWITTSALGTTETVTIGATASAANNAIVIVEEFISV